MLLINLISSCVHYVYIPVASTRVFRGEQGYYAKDRQRVRTQLFTDNNVVRDLQVPAMALLDGKQVSIRNKDVQSCSDDELGLKISIVLDHI